MKMLGYYLLHTTLNSLKKLFKTWFLILILACLLLGGLIGVGVAALVDDEGEQQEEVLPPEEEIDPETALEIVELAAGGITLLVFFLGIMMADKSMVSIFKPADVPILFTSPLKPQSVLMFRLITGLGAALIGGLYMLFQLPNLVLNLGLGLRAALGLLAVWVLAIAFEKLLQMLLSVISFNHEGFRKLLRPMAWGLILVPAVAFYLFLQKSGLEPFQAVLTFFNHPLSRFIPFWGWIKGFAAFLARGEYGRMCLCLAALIVSAPLLVFLIWRVKVDFYEEAMAKTEETAELLRAQQEQRTGKRKKDRAETIRRDGFHRGQGASVFFWRPMYNRFRFARFGFLTKTMITYLLVSAAASAVLRFGVETELFAPLPLALGICVFYRALGDPLQSDIRMDFFITVPEDPHMKLLCSLAAGIADAALDLIPAMLLGALLMKAPFHEALLWLLLILSVDLYAVCVGVFIDLSISVQGLSMAKSVVEILFVYFGLLPDIVLVVLGFVTGHLTLMLLLAGVFNILLSAVFFAISPLFLGRR